MTKTIAGPAAGSQAAVTIQAVCDGTALAPDFVIDAGTAAGTTSQTYRDVPAGATCTVTETVNGSSSTVAVSTVGSPQDVTVPAGGVATAELVDVYHLVPGSLTVTKTIGGVSAGEQGAITIGVDCDGLPLPEFTIPAGATGPQSHTYDNIPAGLTCTVTETADGCHQHSCGDDDRQPTGRDDPRRRRCRRGDHRHLQPRARCAHRDQDRSPARRRAARLRSRSTRCATARP